MYVRVMETRQRAVECVLGGTVTDKLWPTRRAAFTTNAYPVRRSLYLVRPCVR